MNKNTYRDELVLGAAKAVRASLSPTNDGGNGLRLKRVVETIDSLPPYLLGLFVQAENFIPEGPAKDAEMNDHDDAGLLLMEAIRSGEFKKYDGRHGGVVLQLDSDFHGLEVVVGNALALGMTVLELDKQTYVKVFREL